MSGIAELIKEIGSDNISYQMLNTCVTDIKSNKNTSKVTFVTQEITPNDVMNDSGSVGIILWVSRDNFNLALATVTEDTSK